MAEVLFKIADDEGGQSVTCEAHSSELNNHDSLANTIAIYIADNWPGVVMAARLAKSNAILNEAASLQMEDKITEAPPRAIVGADGGALMTDAQRL